MDTKRKHRRFSIHCKVEFSFKGQTYQGDSSDFSLNGLFLQTDTPLAPDSLIDIVVYLTESLTSKLRGKVRRFTKMQNGKKGIGVEILERDSSYSFFITPYYANHARSCLSHRNGNMPGVNTGKIKKVLGCF